MKERPFGTIQLDLDGYWVLADYFGKRVPNTDEDPAFVSGIPHYLDLLDQYQIKTTFFIVGQDLKIPAKRRLVQEIHRRGHEIANHSMNHRCGFGQLPFEEKKEEILQAHQLIQETIGEPPIGFRSPGYDFDQAVLEILESLGYRYDSSLLPTYWGAIFRAFDRIVKKGSVSPTQYALFPYGRAPLDLYPLDYQSPWKEGKRRLKELPISTLPILRLPFHGTFALKGKLPYFHFGLTLFRRYGGVLNYVFHALEFANPAPGLRIPYTVANHIPWEKKKGFYEEVLASITRYYRVVPTRDLVRLRE